MKKFRLLIIFIFCILLSGCGKQSLICTKEEKNDTGKVKYQVSILFENKSISNADLKTTMSIDDEYKDYSDVMVDRFKKILEVYKNKKGIKADMSSSNNVISANIKFNLKKMNNDDKKTTGFDRNGSKKSIKSYYEKEGFSCR